MDRVTLATSSAIYSFTVSHKLWCMIINLQVAILLPYIMTYKISNRTLGCVHVFHVCVRVDYMRVDLVACTINLVVPSQWFLQDSIAIMQEKEPTDSIPSANSRLLQCYRAGTTDLVSRDQLPPHQLS